ncbi:MAG: hypothetical protein RI549_08535, partial [Wenzhouxiangella sp.]|nr:hypothetical protein [Wenzhouxiangella sp.]
MDFRPAAGLEGGEAVVGEEDFGKLAGAVGAEIEEDNHVAVTHALAVGLVEDHGMEEFVGLL